MKIQDFKESLGYLVKAELTAFIWGHAGIGKSSIVKQYADSKGYKFFPFYLGTQSDIGDVLGLAEFQTDKNGAKTTVFATPKWMKDMITYCEENPESGAVIFLDEFNRARRDILSGMFSLALDKTFHTVKLPKNCHVVAAGNPPTDEYVTTDVDETALMARFVHVKLEPSLDEWLAFAKETNVDDNLVQFIRQQPELLEDKRSTFNLPVKVDRRAWSRLNKLFALETPGHLLEQLMPGIVGLERTVAYLEFLKKQDQPLTAKEVLSGKKTDLLTKWCNPENIAGSFINLTSQNVLAYVQELDKTFEESKTGLKPKEKKNLLSFINILPRDLSFKLMQSFINEQSPVFKDFLDTKDDDGIDFEIKCVGIVREAAGQPPLTEVKSE